MMWYNFSKISKLINAKWTTEGSVLSLVEGFVEGFPINLAKCLKKNNVFQIIY